MSSENWINAEAKSMNRNSGAHLASYPMVPGALYLGVKRPGREADHSPPSSAEVKEGILPLLQYVFMAWCLVKPRDKSKFYFMN